VVGAVAGGHGGHDRQAERGADLVAGVDGAGGQASSGFAEEIAVPSDGMNARAMPAAATSDAGSTSTAKLTFARISGRAVIPPHLPPG
jgi:hypothetical protein